MSKRRLEPREGCKRPHYVEELDWGRLIFFCGDRRLTDYVPLSAEDGARWLEEIDAGHHAQVARRAPLG